MENYKIESRGILEGEFFTTEFHIKCNKETHDAFCDGDWGELFISLLNLMSNDEDYKKLFFDLVRFYPIFEEMKPKK